MSRKEKKVYKSTTFKSQSFEVTKLPQFEFSKAEWKSINIQISKVQNPTTRKVHWKVSTKNDRYVFESDKNMRIEISLCSLAVNRATFIFLFGD